MAPAHPVFMIRRGKFKYIACELDPPQLFDIEADPMELTNLADDPAHIGIARAFADEVAARWDSDKIRSDVIATQHQRRAVHAAMEAGLLTSWDYQPPRDASQEFVRNTVSWDDVLHRMQYPAPGSDKGADS